MTVDTNTSSNHEQAEVRRPSVRRVLSSVVAAVLSSALFVSEAPAQTVNVVYSFKSNSLSQYPLLVTPAQGRNGSLYGTTEGSENGTIFRVSTVGTGGQLFALNGTDGEGPAAGLTLAADGNFYGTAFSGGSAGLGVVFKVTPSGQYTDLHDFTGSGDGIFPLAPPIQASDGSLYGGTDVGPGFTGTTVYKYSDADGFSTLYTFDQQLGANIGAPLLQAEDGNLYGTLEGGGTNGCGGIFVLTTSGTLLNDYSFPCGTGPGSPVGLLQAADGNFYGTTFSGGKKGYGTIFKMNQKGMVTLLYSFQGPPLDGKIPDGGLVQATDGNLYGSTSEGGTNGCGTLYQISTAGVYKLLYSFVQTTGKLEGGGLLQHTNGLLYGTAHEGGRQNLGSIYSLDVGLGPFITFVVPAANVGKTAQILGDGLTGTTSVTFNGIPATSFAVKSDTYMTAIVPSGATTGSVVVTTPTRTLTSNVAFRVVN